MPRSNADNLEKRIDKIENTVEKHIENIYTEIKVIRESQARAEVLCKVGCMPIIQLTAKVAEIDVVLSGVKEQAKKVPEIEMEVVKLKQKSDTHTRGFWWLMGIVGTAISALAYFLFEKLFHKA